MVKWKNYGEQIKGKTGSSSSFKEILWKTIKDKKEK